MVYARVRKVGAGMLAVLLSGCAGGGSLSVVVEALEGVRNPSPFVEAYIQQLGPDARWAGPALWTLHVTARDGVAPSFELTPALPAATIKDPGAEPTGLEPAMRVPASALGKVQMPAPQDPSTVRKIPTTEEVRERLLVLAGAIQTAESEEQACSTAVRVRMTRADGSVLERQGCRASPQWSQLVSEFSAEFMGASRFPAAKPAPSGA
jgi:hypothetical protein